MLTLQDIIEERESLVSSNGFLPEKYQRDFRRMQRTYHPRPRPMIIRAGGSEGNYKNSIRVGSIVLVAEKENYASGKLTEGQIIRILTPRPMHPRGIKVLLASGKVGRVQKVIRY